VIKLVSDPNAEVREAAMSTLVEVYRNVGDVVKRDIEKRNGLFPLQAGLSAGAVTPLRPC
jgi:hypothetical protein